MNPNDPINKSDKMNPGNPVRREKLKQMIEHMDEEKLKIMQEIIMEGLRPSSVPQAMVANIMSDVVDIPDSKNTYPITGPADESEIYRGLDATYDDRNYLKSGHAALAQWLSTINQWRESGEGGNPPADYIEAMGGTDYPKYVTWTDNRLEQWVDGSDEHIYRTIENTNPAPGEFTWTGELVQF